ncbi:MAG: prenyltransferase/squalene oxidase repeat-containing protein [Thermoguttaceae bacterium]
MQNKFNGYAKQQNQEKGVDIAEKGVSAAPPWLFSAVLHLILMILLALLLVNIPAKSGVEIVLQPAISESLAEKIDFNTGDPDKVDSPINQKTDETEETPVITEIPEPTENDPTSLTNEHVNPDSIGPDAAVSETHVLSRLYENRTDEARQTALTNGGGDESTEQAVLRGLQWLAKNQYQNGSWSLKGPYSDGLDHYSMDNQIAATGLALLAFQGHGNTYERGDYSKNVKNAWNWLLSKQQNDGCFYEYEEATYQHRFYTQGICTIALCELYAMTKNPELKEQLREKAQKAIDYCVKYQNQDGGWRYGLYDDASDVSVTGWIMVALYSGKNSGLTVPQETFDRISAFLDDVAFEDGSRYPYMKGNREPRRSMTAEGLLCREFLGWQRDDQRLIDGIKWLTRPENLVCYTGRDAAGRKNDRDVYYWYYATQTLHHYRGPEWKTWNDAMKQAICENQERKPGSREYGSWNPNMPTRDAWCTQGRLYVTCFSIITLEVYYRHLPIYREK